MNIWAGNGDTVKFVNAGNEGDGQEAVERGLVVGGEYIVKNVEVFSDSSYVKLCGIKGDFNTVLFEDVCVNALFAADREIRWGLTH